MKKTLDACMKSPPYSVQIRHLNLLFIRAFITILTGNIGRVFHNILLSYPLCTIQLYSIPAIAVADFYGSSLWTGG